MKTIENILIILMLCVSSHAQQSELETTHYVFPEFTEGVVLKKNGLKTDAMLNYNALTEEMVFEDRGQKLAIIESEVLIIDTVFIKDRKFIVLDGKFVEYLDQAGCELYVEYKCRIKDDSRPSAYSGSAENSMTGSLSSFMTGNTVYEINLPGSYKAEPYYYFWLNKDGEINRFINLRQLRKLYKGKEDLFNEYVQENDVKYTDIQSIIRLVDYLGSS